MGATLRHRRGLLGCIALSFVVAGCRDAGSDLPAFAARLPGHTVCVYWSKGPAPATSRLQQLRRWMLELGFHETTVPDASHPATAFLADPQVAVGWATLAESTTFVDALASLPGDAEEWLFVDLSLWLDSTLSGRRATGGTGAMVNRSEDLLQTMVQALGLADLRGVAVGIRTVAGGATAEGVILGSGSGFGPVELLRGASTALPLPQVEPMARGQLAFRVDGTVARQIVQRALTMTEAGGSLLERLAVGGQRLLVASVADPLPDLSGWLTLRYLDAGELALTLVPDAPEKARAVLEERWPVLLRKQLVEQLGLSILEGRVWMRMPARGPFPRSTEFKLSDREPLQGGLLWASFLMAGKTGMLERAELRILEGGPRILRLELDLP